MPGEVEQIVEKTALPGADVLSEEATRPASLSLMDQIKTGGASGESGRVEMRGQRRGPGRPRKVQQPSVGAIPSTSDTEDERIKRLADAEKLRRLQDAKASAKKRKAAEYSDKIVGELNDQLMLLLCSSGVPAPLLFKNGMAPVRTVNENYTPIANQLAIQPLQARAISNFLVELEFSDKGAKAVDLVAGGTLGMVIKGALAVGATFAYVKSVTTAMQQLGPLLQQIKEQQMRVAAENAAAHRMAQGTPA